MMTTQTRNLVGAFFILLLAFSANAAESDFAERLQRLEDREDIRELILAYARHVDNRDWDAFAGLFAENAGTWDGGMGVAEGREAIIEMMTDSIGTEPNTGAGGSGLGNLHLVTNEAIQVEGDHATARSKWVFVMPDGEGGPQMVLVGHYDDELIREGGEWRFLRRTVYADMSRPTNLPGLNE